MAIYILSNKTHGKLQVDATSFIVEPSLYSSYIDGWLANFAPDNLLILDGDNFLRAPWQEILKVQEFLGLKREITVNNYILDEDKGSVVPGLVLRFSAANITNQFLRFFCFRFTNGTVSCGEDSKGHTYDPLEEGFESRVRQYFAPFNREFYRKVGRDFGWREI